MSQEKPQLEARRSQLLQSLANDNQMLRELEDRTLEMLQRSEMNILDDQDLIDTLQRSQDMAVEIRHRVIMTKDTEQKLNAARKRYLPVSCRQRSYLYFYSKTLIITISDLRTVKNCFLLLCRCLPTARCSISCWPICQQSTLCISSRWSGFRICICRA